jgi:diguanylate cyclase (GGDEF)-like protein
MICSLCCYKPGKTSIIARLGSLQSPAVFCRLIRFQTGGDAVTLQYIEQFQINLYVILMLFAVLIILQKHPDLLSYSKRLLKTVILINIAALIVEPITWISDGAAGTGGYLLGYASNALLVLLGPLLAGSSAAYADYKIFHDRERLRRRKFYQIPTAAVLVLLVINGFYPLYFTIDPVTAAYRTASFDWIRYAALILIYLYMLILVLRSRSRAGSHLVMLVMLFFAIPIVGMLVQVVYSRLNFSWTTVSLGILIAYVFLESTTGERDVLTDLYSRASYEEYVHNLIEERRSFQLMMIDLNGFKLINDQFGHLTGDRVLIEFSRLLRLQFPNEKIIARLAGDEFVIIFEREAGSIEPNLAELELRCRDSVIAQVQTLRFSHGLQKYEPHMTFDELYMQVDHNMYVNKFADGSVTAE